MLPASCRLFSDSKSKSSTLFPSTTTTRVSSAWVASISIFFVMISFGNDPSGRRPAPSGVVRSGGIAAARRKSTRRPATRPSIGRLSGIGSVPARFTAVGLRHGRLPPRAQSVRAGGPGGLVMAQAPVAGCRAHPGRPWSCNAAGEATNTAWERTRWRTRSTRHHMHAPDEMTNGFSMGSSARSTARAPAEAGRACIFPRVAGLPSPGHPVRRTAAGTSGVIPSARAHGDALVF